MCGLLSGNEDPNHKLIETSYQDKNIQVVETHQDFPDEFLLIFPKFRLMFVSIFQAYCFVYHIHFLLRDAITITFMFYGFIWNFSKSRTMISFPPTYTVSRNYQKQKQFSMCAYLMPGNRDSERKGIKGKALRLQYRKHQQEDKAVMW